MTLCHNLRWLGLLATTSFIVGSCKTRGFHDPSTDGNLEDIRITSCQNGQKLRVDSATDGFLNLRKESDSSQILRRLAHGEKVTCAGASRVNGYVVVLTSQGERGLAYKQHLTLIPPAPDAKLIDTLGALQVVTVTTEAWGSTSGVLRFFERDSLSSPWVQQDFSAPVSLGRTGLAWGRGMHPTQSGALKREGDGKAPAGIFTLGEAFGAASSLQTGLTYSPMHNNHWCVDDVSSSHYNQIVDMNEVGRTAVGSSSEHMRRDLSPGDNLYEIGAFIKQNPENLRGAGSCVFLHVWRRAGSPTSGCTAMEKGKLAWVLARLQKGRTPLLVQLPAGEYVRLRGAWGLPAIRGWQ